jgi:hypothetical protein
MTRDSFLGLPSSDSNAFIETINIHVLAVANCFSLEFSVNFFLQNFDYVNLRVKKRIQKSNFQRVAIFVSETRSLSV